MNIQISAFGLLLYQAQSELAQLPSLSHVVVLNAQLFHSVCCVGFCSALPDDEESEECWNAYQYYEDKRVCLIIRYLCLQLHHHMLSDACLYFNCYVSTASMLQHEAEDACEVEWEKNDGLTQPQCARLEQFEGFVREMVGEGHIVNFITTLQSLSKADQRRLAKELEASGRRLLSVYHCCQTSPLHCGVSLLMLQKLHD